MDVRKYKEVQDRLKKLEHVEYTDEKFERATVHIKNYLTENNVKFKEIEENGIKKINVFYKNKVVSKYSIGRYPNNAYLGLRIANNKILTDYYLEINEIPTPKYQLFKENQKESALEFVKSIKTHVVIKPKNLSQAIGVFTEVDEANFDECWSKNVTVQKKYNPKQEVEVIIQEQVEGFELRVNVAEGKVLNATVKLPWVLEGDGKKTIKDHINERNEEVKTNPLFSMLGIKFNDDLDEHLKATNKSLSSVLEEGELYMITKIPHSRLGARKYNVTDILHPNILKLGVDAIKAVPGLHTGGIDMFIPSLESDTGVILEVNKNPETGTSIYPIVGETHNLLHEAIKSFMLDQKVINEDIEDLNDLSKEEQNILLKRYKFLYEKDKFNTRVITRLHHQYVEKLK